MKSRVSWAVSYLLSVLIFSGVYNLYWNINPDSFIVNQELNIQPFDEINKFLWGDEDNYKVGYSYSLNELKISYDKEYQKIKSVVNRLQKLKEEKEILSERSEKLADKQFEEVDTNFAIYDAEQLEPFRQIEKEIASKVSHLEKLVPKDIRTDADIEKIKLVGEAKVELAHARVNTAHQALKNSQAVLDDVLFFVSPETIQEFNRINQLERTQYEEWRSLENTRGDLRVEAIRIISNHRKSILDKVNWFDFVFYSVGISTTTTFGDLVPNDTGAKLIVSLQLLVCVFILGGFVNVVLKS